MIHLPLFLALVYMAVVRVTKCVEFEMAHALWNYDGLCQHIHGHSYKLEICIKGEALQSRNSHKDGMLFDFKEIKALVNNIIVKPFDHAFVTSDKAPYSTQLPQLPQLFDKHVVVNYQPTCENFIIDFAHRIRQALPPQLQLYSVKLQETTGSFAEWYADDQQDKI